jgi:MFS superfamily sulfate permease-like transporter
VVISSVIVALAGPNIDLVAEIPRGLPSFGIPTGIDGSTWLTLLAGGAVVALVGFSEGWGASANISRKTHDQLDTNQEFRAYGVGNIGAGLLGGMVVTGSLSKSSGAMTAGARSQMTNIFLAVIVLLTLLFLAPLFQWLPETVLAAIVINAMTGSANPRKLNLLWRIDRPDFVLGFITFFLVLSFDLLPAMIVGIVLSVIYVIYRTSFPGRAVLGRVPDTGDFEAIVWQYGQRSGTTHSNAKYVPGVVVFRFSAPLIFSNAEYFKNGLKEILIKAGGEGKFPHTVVVDCEEVSYIDNTGASAMKDFFNYAQRYSVELSLARVHSGTYKLLELTGVIDEIGERRIYDSVRHAVDAATALASGKQGEKGGSA